MESALSGQHQCTRCSIISNNRSAGLDTIMHLDALETLHLPVLRWLPPTCHLLVTLLKQQPEIRYAEGPEVSPAWS
jgi:hypothetical protein